MCQRQRENGMEAIYFLFGIQFQPRCSTIKRMITKRNFFKPCVRIDVVFFNSGWLIVYPATGLWFQEISALSTNLMGCGIWIPALWTVAFATGVMAPRSALAL